MTKYLPKSAEATTKYDKALAWFPYGDNARCGGSSRPRPRDNHLPCVVTTGSKNSGVWAQKRAPDLGAPSHF